MFELLLVLVLWFCPLVVVGVVGSVVTTGPGAAAAAVVARSQHAQKSGSTMPVSLESTARSVKSKATPSGGRSRAGKKE